MSVNPTQSSNLHSDGPYVSAQCLTALPAKSVSGVAVVPGDKSISHRALMLASQAIGRSTITGLLEGEDVLCTAKALRAMGVAIERKDDGTWQVDGVGIGGLAEPEDVLDMGNAGTGSRLLMGLLCTYPFTSFFTGDESLRSRPMARITTPLMQMGASFIARSKTRLPLAVVGSSELVPMEYTLPVASAQVKSAILLAGLNTAGTTTVIEPHATRDHTERMLTAMGASITSDKHSDGATHISIQGHPTLSPLTLQVPADISSAAFLMVAGLLFENGTITLPHVGINPLRTGLIDTLKEMGADITFSDKTIHAGEPIATITVAASSPLKGIRVPAERAPSMIDEYPILAVAAAHAKGTSVFEGLGELRVKESDRLSAIAQGLKACGVIVHETEDSLTIEGCNGKPPGGATMIQTHHDHRIAMSFLIMGLTAKQSVTIDDASMISTSFPDFIPLMESLGASFVL